MYTREELNKVVDILETDKACECISKVDDMIGDDSDLPNATDLIEYALSQYRKKSMYIHRAVFTKLSGETERGFVIETENDDKKGYSLFESYKCEDNKISVSIINAIAMLSSAGYKINYSSEVKVIEE